MELYGTDLFYLEKIGSLSSTAVSLLRGAAAAGSVALAHHDSVHRDEVVAEAEAMNQAFRALEEARMAQVIGGLKGEIKQASALLDPEVLKIAEAVGRSLAHEEEKRAGIASTVMGALGAVGGALKKVPSLFTTGTGKMNAARSAVGDAVKPGLMNRMMQPFSATARLEGAAGQAGLGSLKPAATAAAAGAVPAAASAATPVAAAAVPAAAEAATKSKPLISGWTKAKIGLGGAAALGVAGTGYAGYKGLQGARDFMMQPAHSGGQWGQFGPIPQANVNSSGYTQPII